jgi:enoyl-CoA hydratase/carnithine racemase
MNEQIKIIKSKSSRDLLDQLNLIRAEKDLRVVISDLTGESVLTEKSDFDKALLEQIRHFPVPIITIVKNNVKGLLFEIVMSAHICISSGSAMFKLANSEKIKSQIGTKNAEKLNSDEDQVDAETALDLGIINKIADAGSLEKEALAMAGQISALAPLAIRSCLKAVNQGLEMDLEEGLELETKLFSEIFATADMKEGTKAFFEKRPPKFSGK